MVDWSLAGANSFQNALSTGLQLGQMVRAKQGQREQRGALAAYANDPSEKNLAGVISVAPEVGMGLRSDMLRAQALQGKVQQEQAEQRRADLPTLTKLLDGSTDDASYQANLSTAKSLGFDVSGAPATYDPAWVAQQKSTAALLSSPKGQEALSTAGKQAVDLGLKPGTPEYASTVRRIIENDQSKTYVVNGETHLYAPKLDGSGEAVGGVPPAALEALRKDPSLAPQFREKYGVDPSQYLGGPTQPASGGFRPGG